MSSSALQQTRRSPRTLRDLLSESSISSPSPSSGFKPIPRNPIRSTTMRSLIEMDLNNSSSRNSNRRILNSLLNALVKRFSTLAVKSPSILSRSVSRKLSRKSNSRNCRGSAEIKVPLRIKDIVRWKSFGDREEEQHQPLDFSSASSSSSSSKGSSWSDSDFSSCDCSFAECPRNDVVEGKRFLPPVGADSVYVTSGNPAGPKGNSKLRRLFEEEEQRSPVSVLETEEYDAEHNDIDDEYEEGGDKTEKMAWKLLHFTKSSGSVERIKANNNLEKLLLDFFRDEAEKRRVDNEIRNKEDDENDDAYECEILRRTQDWMNGSFGDDFENSDKDACIRDMDEREGWNKFEEQKQELACDVEAAILQNLILEMIFNGSFSC
ncbi:uncharacterized protein LOC114718025 [Neltuma alba]|uniref:uncharacterized protein LOC114718025 n=1 Tax=Neltuma alba TaxID=207710 RepID=UPI0010A2AA90|nr:uncharacterized protein LOC114718025 [Prosopis alba]